MRKTVLAIIFVSLLIILSWLTYAAYQVTNDFGILKIIMILLDFGFILGFILYLFSFSIKHVIYWLILPIFCFYMILCVDINIILRIIAILIYTYIGLKLHKVLK